MHRAMWLWWEKPASSATWPAGSSPRISSDLARSTRRWMTYSWTGSPVERLNKVFRCEALMSTTPARRASDRSSSRCSSIYVVSRWSCGFDSP